MLSRLIFKYNTTCCKVIMLPLRFKSSYHHKSFKSNDSKLYNSISRSKKQIKDLAFSNSFEYFVTLTTTNEFNSYDLDRLNRYISQTIRNMRKKYKTDLSYILIPEKHKKRRLALTWIL